MTIKLFKELESIYEYIPYLTVTYKIKKILNHKSENVYPGAGLFPVTEIVFNSNQGDVRIFIGREETEGYKGAFLFTYIKGDKKLFNLTVERKYVAVEPKFTRCTITAEDIKLAIYEFHKYLIETFGAIDDVISYNKSQMLILGE